MLKSMVLLWLVIVSAPALAGVINVVSAGFEDPQLSGGSMTWSSANPLGWTDLQSGQATLASGATIIHDATRARTGNQYLHFQISNQSSNQRVIQNFSQALTHLNELCSSENKVRPHLRVT